MRPRTGALALAGSLLVLVGGATAAAAAIDGPCDGVLRIDGGDAVQASLLQPGDAIVIPAEAQTASWEGYTDVVITDHSGSVGVAIGPGSIELADWSGENADEETEASGDYAIAEARDLLPFELVGVYEVVGTHAGTGGSCSGSVLVSIEGNPLTTPLGIAGAAVTAVGALGLLGVGIGAGGGGAGGASAGTASGTEVV